MALLGEAWIVLRAITEKLHSDVKDGLDAAAKDVESEGNKAGSKYGESFSKSAGKKIEEDAGIDIFDGMDIGFSDRAAEEGGKAKGESWMHGFLHSLSSSLSGLDTGAQFKTVFPDSKEDGDKKGKSWADGFLKGIAGGLAKASATLSAALAPMLMIGGIAGLVGGAVGGITDLAAGLVSLIGPLSQATTLLGVGFASGISTLVQGAVIGTMWMKELTGSAKNVPPAAAAARAEFLQFKKSFQEMVGQIGSQTVFPALNSLFKELGTTALPVLRTAIQSTGQAFAGVINQLAGLLKNPVFSSNLGTVFQSNATSIRNMGGAFLSIVQAMTAVLAVAAPLINEFTTWVQKLSQHAATAAEAAQKTGKLTEALGQAAGILKTLGGLFSNTFGIIRDISIAAGPLGQALIGAWGGSAARLNEYLKSAQGLKALGNFFDPNGQVVGNLRSIGVALKVAAGGFAVLAQNAGIQQFFNGLTQVLPGVIKFLDSATTAIGQLGGAIGTAFASGAGMAGVAAMSQGIKDLGGALSLLAPALGPLMQIIGNLVSNLSTALMPALSALSRVMPQLVGPFDQIGKAVGTVLNQAILALVNLLVPLANIVANLATIFGSNLSAAIAIASAVLQVLADILSPISDVLAALAPLITAVTVAFAAWKVATSVAAGLQTLAYVMGIISTGGGAFAGVLGKGATALSGMATALPVVGVLVALVGAAFAISAQQSTDWANALLQGGNAAEQASVQMANAKSAADQLSSGWKGALGSITGLGVETRLVSKTVDDATKKYQDQLNAMSPLERANAMLTQATNDYNSAVGDLGPNSALAVGAQERMKYWSDQVQQATIKDAIAHGQLAQAAGAVATQMYGELAAHQALVGASGATKSAVLGLEQAQNNLLESQKQFKPNSLEVQQSQLGVQQAVQGVIGTAQQSAQVWAEQAVKAGKFASDATGMAQAVTAGMQVQRAELQKLANAIPAGPLHDAVQKAIDDFSRLAKLPPADPKVVGPDTKAFDKGAIDVSNAMTALGKLKALPLIGAPDLGPLTGATNKALGDVKSIDNAKAKPTAYLDANPFNLTQSQVLDSIFHVGAQKPTPTAYLNPAPFQAALSAALAGSNHLAGQKPTPTADLKISPFEANFMATVGNLAALNSKTANPTATLIDHASGTAAAIAASINAIHDKSVLVTVTQQMETIYHTSNARGMATGGEVEAPNWTTVGEHGRELVFLTRGQYVATYQQAQTILAAATLESQRQARAMASVGLSNSSLRASQITSSARQMAASTVSGSLQGGSSESDSRPTKEINVPIAVYPSAQMDERALAKQVGVEVGYQLRRV